MLITEHISGLHEQLPCCSVSMTTSSPSRSRPAHHSAVSPGRVLPSDSDRPAHGLHDFAFNAEKMLWIGRFQMISYHLATSPGSSVDAHCASHTPELVYHSRSSTLVVQVVANELESRI